MEQFSDAEKEAAKYIKEKRDSELPKAVAAFKQYVEDEKDPVKKAKLREFVPHIEKVVDLNELEWFRVKAVETAEASRKLADQAKAREAARKAFIKQMAIEWIIGAVASLIIFLTGIGSVYYYSMPDGNAFRVDSYEGAAFILDEGKEKAEFTHSGYWFNEHVTIRLTLIAIILVYLVFRSLPLLS